MSEQLGFDAVAFTPGALLTTGNGNATPDPSRPGARRVIHVLTQLGVRVAVVIDSDQTSVAATIDQLGDAGLGQLPVIPTGAPADTPRVHRPDVVLGDPQRTLIVATTDDPPPPSSAEANFAGVVVVAPDQLLAHAILDFVDDRQGPARAAAMLVAPLDSIAMDAANERHQALTKPPGSLGRLETLGIQLAGISGRPIPPPPSPAAVAVFAADHGVHAQGVSPWPQEVTTQMVTNFLNGGAAINVLAETFGCKVVVIDVGVVGDLPLNVPDLIHRKVDRGTRDLALGPAMTPEQAMQALDAGAEAAIRLVGNGARCLLTGDMGIANTTASAALIGALTGRRAGNVTGVGSGLPEAALPRKSTIVAEAAAQARAVWGEDPVGVLSQVGGFEHAALAGFIIAGAASGVPVITDGVIAAAALLVASRLVPGVETLVVPGHRSSEPGSAAVLDTLNLIPLMDLDLRLGEGTGAALALPIVEAAARVLADMATFDQAGVSSKQV